MDHIIFERSLNNSYLVTRIAYVYKKVYFDHFAFAYLDHVDHINMEALLTMKTILNGHVDCFDHV